VRFTGKHLRVESAKTLYPPVQKPYPPLWFGGSSDAAIELAGEQVDVYLTWDEPPSAVAEKIAKARAAAAKHGRTLRFGIRLHVIVRETSEGGSIRHDCLRAVGAAQPTGSPRQRTGRGAASSHGDAPPRASGIAPG